MVVVLIEVSGILKTRTSKPAMVDLAKQDLEGALAVKNLAEVEIRRIEGI